MAEYKVPALIQGEGGGGKGGGSSRVAEEDPNTLRSKNVATLIDLIGEGPIYGLMDGLKSVYFDGVAVENADGSFNYNGLTLVTRLGYPDQSVIPGNTGVQTEYAVGKEVRNDAPITESFTHAEADVVNVKVQVQALTYQDKKTGDLKGTSVDIAIDLRDGTTGEWLTAIRRTISGKTTSPYQRQWKIRLPTGGGPAWYVRVRRITSDDQGSNYSNSVYFSSMTAVTEAKLTYPDSALIGIRADASQFGTSIPDRAYLIRGLIIKVPSNYDPITREYTGTWNGTFKNAWTNNPAWILYDLVTNTRYGAKQSQFDKWSLYSIAQYCDELVPDGYGGQEPRFTCNLAITAQEDAYSAIDSLASVFRGMTYWASSQIAAVADRPGTPVRQFTRANIVDDFVRQGTSMKARHSVVLVTWNDPDDQYKQTIEMVTDQEMIEKWGWRQTEVTAFGCTSRGQALRTGKWIMYTEKYETETLTFTAGSDAMDLRPGDIIQISDPAVAGVRLGGRLVESGTSTLTLDRIDDDIDTTANWNLTVTLPSGAAETREIASFDGMTVMLENPLTDTPVHGAVWMMSSSDVAPELFKIIGLSDPGREMQPSITALSHNPGKYELVEEDIPLPPRPVSLVPTGKLSPPSNLTAVAHTYLEGVNTAQGISVSWTPSEDPRVSGYRLEAKAADAFTWEEVYAGAGVSYKVPNAYAGEWSFRVRGVDALGISSVWVYLIQEVENYLMPTMPTAIDFDVGTMKVGIQPQGDMTNQMWECRRTDVSVELGQVESAGVLVGIGTAFTDTELQPLKTYYYYVRGVNTFGESDWYPGQVETQGNADAYLQMLNEKVTMSELATGLSEEIQKISGTGPGSVGDAIDQQVTQVRDELEAASGALQDAIDTVAGNLSTTSQGLTQRVDDLDDAVATVSSGLTSEAQRLELAIDGVRDNAQSARDDLQEASDELQVRVEASEEAIINESITREDEVESVASTVKALKADTVDGNARIASLERSSAERDLIEAIQFKAIEVANATSSASVRTEEFARVEEDAALAQISTALTARLGAAESTITTVDQARIDGDSVLASRIGELVAKIESTPQFMNGFEADTEIGEWTMDSTASLTADTSTFVSGTQSALITSNRASASSSGSTQAARAPLPPGTVDAFLGYEVVIRAFIRKPATNAATQMAIAYSTNAVGNSGWHYFTPTDNWELVEFTYTVPSSADGATNYIGIWGDTSGNNKGVLVDNVQIRRADSEVSDVTAAIQAEQQTRANADIALASDITGLQASFDDVESAITTEQQARANGDSALASDITSLQSSVNSANSAITSEQQTRANADSALATRASDIESRLGNAEADITAEQKARSDADSALTSSINSAVSRLDDAESAISSEATTRANADNALTSSLNSMSSRVGDVESDITDEATTRANADSALATRASNLESRMGDAESNISTYEQAWVDAVEAVATSVEALESRLDDSGGTIVDEARVRAAEDEALAAKLSGVEATVLDSVGRINNLARVRSEQDSIEAVQFSAIEATKASSAASIRVEENVRVTEVEALASRTSSVEARVGQTESSITSEQQARTSADSALAQDIQQLSTDFGNTAADIRTEQSASIAGVNYARDGSFSRGDASLWEYTPHLRFEKREPGGNNPLTADAPADNFVVMGEDKYGENRYNSSVMQECQPGDQISVSFWFSRVNWANGRARFHIQWFDSHKESIKWEVTHGLELTDYGNKTWQRADTVTVTAPSTTAYARVMISMLPDNTQGGFAFTGVQAYLVSSALAERVETVQTSLGNQIATVEQTANTNISTLNGKVTDIGALYTAKVQANGLVGGFSIYNNGNEVTAGFDVNTLYVGSSSSDALKPFIISDGKVVMREALIDSLTFTKLRDDSGNFLVSNGKLKAQYIQADDLQVKWANIQGVSVGTADIDNAAITNAKLGSAAVDTLKIQGQAVTIGASAYGEGWVYVLGTTDVQSITFNPQGGRVLLNFSCIYRPAWGSEYISGTYIMRITLKRGNTTIDTYDVSYNLFSEETQLYLGMSFVDNQAQSSSTEYTIKINVNFGVNGRKVAYSARSLSATSLRR